MQLGFAARLSAVALAAGFIFAIGQQDASAAVRHHGRRHAHEKNVLQAANAAGFHTFVKAVNASGMAGVLSHGGPYTVFAPDDAAFNKLGKSELDDIMNDKKALHAVVANHIVRGKYDAAELQGKDDRWLTTLDGEHVPVKVKSGVEVGGALVTKPDIKTSNGWLHGVDEVIKPRGVR